MHSSHWAVEDEQSGLSVIALPDGECALSVRCFGGQSPFLASSLAIAS